MTTNPPAPESIIELLVAVRQVASQIVVDIKKQICVTEMCRCKDCENTENDNYESDDLSGIDVDDD